MRIVSLVPSLTKTICDFGLKEKIVGVTNFCVDPPDLYKNAARIGGTKDPNLDLIRALNPTHIIVNTEENTADHIAELGRAFNVLVTFPKSPLDVPNLLRDMGKFLDCCELGHDQAKTVETYLKGFQRNNLWSDKFGKKFLYLIWRNPWMAVGQDTYISNFLNILGLENILKESERYPTLSKEFIRSLDVDVVFMSSEPWPFRKRDAQAWREEARDGVNSKIYWIDGKLLSWYGSTTIEALDTANDILKLTRSLDN